MNARTDAHASDSTRERLIEAISVDGPIAAGDLAERFHLTGAAIRRHLSQLHAEGIIEEKEAPNRPRGRGRPRKEFVLAAKAPDTDANSRECESLALLAMRELERAGGHEALVTLAKARTSEWEAEFERRYERENARGEVPPSKRVRLVIDLLKELGYAASLRPVTVTVGPPGKDGASTRTLTTVQMCQGRCPVQDIAAKHPELCEVETAALSRMLGVPVQRLSTRAAGAHVCTTHLTPAMSAAIAESMAEGELASDVTTDLLTEGRKP
ncbi:winged helix-turn-helix transcriptional regulator [Dermabacter vaginalis]|uniref:Winged helix-turn-helix transcriptional regulator n=1 Tax=Dermabacter vaginalis TaxID=1630135 RepID=A0ABX6A3Z5_9MICO|nr:MULTISPECIES: winged helix-turn-helix transcriptional regulator [Dermabacter]MCG7442725.1 winged helix-turn-helix transcriptional regulator [Dermabacter vaginalis]MCT2150789.1 winged helix-turn-helix transcriptional regulator [Dermabacter vaginalis]QEU11860.1 winged helix-turn-helix transcriptional regulator [Dermabacter vaginalis]